MYKKLIGMAALAFSFALNQTAFADASMCGKGLKSMVESLNLSKDQKDKIKPILEQLKTSIKNDGKQMHDLETQINQQSSSANMDQGTVDGLIDQKTKLIGDVMKAKVAAKNQIAGILNDQQKQKLHAMMKDAEEKMMAKFKDCHDD